MSKVRVLLTWDCVRKWQNHRGSMNKKQ